VVILADAAPSETAPTETGVSTDAARVHDGPSSDGPRIGTSCRHDHECVGLDQCAIPPGKAVGYCTIECDPKSPACPPDYFCFDLSVFDPNEAPICAPRS
jgi:hypothetical protein